MTASYQRPKSGSVFNGVNVVAGIPQWAWVGDLPHQVDANQAKRGRTNMGVIYWLIRTHVPQARVNTLCEEVVLQCDSDHNGWVTTLPLYGSHGSNS